MKNLYCYFILVMLSFSSCKTHPSREDINTLLLSETKIPVEPTKDVITSTTETDQSADGSKTKILTTENHKLTQQLEKFVAFDPNANSLFPGSIVQGKGLPDGLLFPVTTVRSPLRITMTDFYSKGKLSFSRVLKNPNPGDINDSIHSMIKQGFNSPQSANITFSEQKIYTLEQAFFNLGASYSWASGQISGSFTTKKSDAYSKHLVRIVEKFFTVSCEAPSSPVDFISPKASKKDLEALNEYMKDEANSPNPLCYVSSVTYGKEVWLLIESSSSSDSLEAAINASFGGLGNGTNISTEVKNSSILQESSIQALVLGGSAKAASDYITGDKIEGIKKLLSQGEAFSDTNLPRPISYNVSYFKDNSLAAVKSVADYHINTLAVSGISALQSAFVHFDPQGDGKDQSTGLRVYLHDSREILPGNEVAFNDLYDNTTQGIRFSDKDPYDFPLKIHNASNDSLLKHGTVIIQIFPHGNETWKFNMTLNLRFKNGTELPINFTNLKITENDREHRYPY